MDEKKQFPVRKENLDAAQRIKVFLNELYKFREHFSNRALGSKQLGVSFYLLFISLQLIQVGFPIDQITYLAQLV
jgi:hypothetical protein